MLNSNISRRQSDLRQKSGIALSPPQWWYPVLVCLFVWNTQTNVCLSVCWSETHGQTRENTKIPVFSLFSDSQWSLWPLAHHSWAKCWHNLCHICHVSISHSVQWNTLLLSWGKRERGAILSADHLLEADSLQIGASIVASRGPAHGLGPVHNFSIQFNSIWWIELNLNF